MTSPSTIAFIGGGNMARSLIGGLIARGTAPADIRVASDGMLRPCLATNDGTSAFAAAQSADVEGVKRALASAWAQKPDGETWRGCTEDAAANVSIRSIGG